MGMQVKPFPDEIKLRNLTQTWPSAINVLFHNSLVGLLAENHQSGKRVLSCECGSAMRTSLSDNRPSAFRLS